MPCQWHEFELKSITTFPYITKINGKMFKSKI